MPSMATGGPGMTRNSSEFDLGSRLAALRAVRGLSQGTASRLAGLSPAYLSRIETGRVHPTFATVLRILDALRADVEDLRAADRARPPSAATCPITSQGRCLLETIRTESEVARAEGREVYTMREVQILRDLATYMRTASAERVRAVEMLLQELLRR
jgi:transcriptional regulator with XRE-family HTH domain